MGKSNADTDLDDAEAVIVESGAAVDADSGGCYSGYLWICRYHEDIDITDDAAALISVVMLF